MSLPGAPDLKDIGKRFTSFFESIPLIFQGVGDELNGVGEGIKLGIDDIFRLIKYIFIFINSYVGCGIYFLSNLKGCFFYYLLETFGQTLYLPVRFIIWCSQQAGNDIQGQVDTFWKTMDDKVDKPFYKMFKFHLLHYGHPIREKCYVCKRLKTIVVKNQATVVNDDFKDHPPEDGKDGPEELSEILKIIKGRGAKLYEGVDKFNYAIRT